MLPVRPPSWAYCTTNINVGAEPVIPPGTSVTAGASNADGSSVSLLANLSHDVEFLVIQAHGFAAAGSNNSVALDILFDPAGGSSWATDPLINDLLVGQCALVTSSPTVQIAWNYFFPIWLPAGCSIGARAKTGNAGTLAGKINIFAHGGNANPGSWWCGSAVETIGVTNSQGTNHTAGNTGANSAWTNFGSALSARCGALQFAVQGTNTDTTQAAASYYFEFGANSTRIGPRLMRSTNTTESGWFQPSGPIFAELDAGTQLQVRGMCSGTAEALDVAAYAVI